MLTSPKGRRKKEVITISTSRARVCTDGGVRSVEKRVREHGRYVTKLRVVVAVVSPGSGRIVLRHPSTFLGESRNCNGAVKLKKTGKITPL